MNDRIEQFDVRLIDEAISDIRAIKSYIESELQNPSAATRVVDSIFVVARGLSTLPHRNRVLAKYGNLETRVARAGKYLLLYVIQDKTVKIFAILHSTRDIEGRLASLIGRLD